MITSLSTTEFGNWGGEVWVPDWATSVRSPMTESMATPPGVGPEHDESRTGPEHGLHEGVLQRGDLRPTVISSGEPVDATIAPPGPLPTEGTVRHTSAERS